MRDGEDDALGREPVERGRRDELVAQEAQVLVVLVVGDDEHDVRAVVLGRGPQRRREVGHGELATSLRVPPADRGLAQRLDAARVLEGLGQVGRLVRVALEVEEQLGPAVVGDRRRLAPARVVDAEVLQEEHVLEALGARVERHDLAGEVRAAAPRGLAVVELAEHGRGGRRLARVQRRAQRRRERLDAREPRVPDERPVQGERRDDGRVLARRDARTDDRERTRAQALVDLVGVELRGVAGRIGEDEEDRFACGRVLAQGLEEPAECRVQPATPSRLVPRPAFACGGRLGGEAGEERLRGVALEERGELSRGVVAGGLRVERSALRQPPEERAVLERAIPRRRERSEHRALQPPALRPGAIANPRLARPRPREERRAVRPPARHRHVGAGEAPRAGEEPVQHGRPVPFVELVRVPEDPDDVRPLVGDGRSPCGV